MRHPQRKSLSLSENISSGFGYDLIGSRKQKVYTDNTIHVCFLIKDPNIDAFHVNGINDIGPL